MTSVLASYPVQNQYNCKENQWAEVQLSCSLHLRVRLQVYLYSNVKLEDNTK